MFAQEPPLTPYDFRFQIAGIPVRIHPFFWLSTLLLGGSRRLDLVLIFAVVSVLSILVHELGHAVAIRYFGWSPRVVLYGMGGLAIHERYGRGRRDRSLRLPVWFNEQIIISAAGPAAGFALAGATILGLFLANRSMPLDLTFFNPNWTWDVGRGPSLAYTSNIYVLVFVADMLYVNVFWSLMNLLPVFPLDGGKIAREWLVASNASEGERHSLIISMLTGGLIALYAASHGQIWIAVMFGMLAYQSYQIANRWGGNPW